MIKIQKIIQQFIQSESYANTSIHYDANAIKIRMHENNSDNRYIFIYIYHPWRITVNCKIINSSDLYPYESECRSKSIHKKKFDNYCNSTKLLSTEHISDVVITSGSNDLIIKWTNGTMLECFCLNTNEWSYHIYDYLNCIQYDCCYGKIVRSKFDTPIT